MRPQGTHTFLFADIERSTSLLRRLGSESYANLLEREAEILGDACAAHGGRLVDREGDGCMFVFSSATAAILGAARAQPSDRRGALSRTGARAHGRAHG
jgi:class 3 adenylate cyclase